MFGKMFTKILQRLSLSNGIQSGFNIFLNAFLYFEKNLY